MKLKLKKGLSGKMIAPMTRIAMDNGFPNVATFI
jgi:hypothetical protein